MSGAAKYTPARIAGEDGFFGIGRIAVFRFKHFEQPDGGDVVAGLLVQSTLSNAMRLGDAEVAGGFLFDSRVEVEEDARYRGSSVGGNAHSRVACSQASWYCIFLTDSSS